MEAILLVAGKGTRLRPLTDNVPKCFTEVHGKAIVVNALEQLACVGVTRVVLVVGYLASYISERLGDSFAGMQLSYVENAIYGETNTSYSLLLGLEACAASQEPVLVLEGDVFFETQLLANFLQENQGQTATIVQAYNPTLDGSFVALANSDAGSQQKPVKIISDWIHKSQRESDFVIEDKFKTVNIHLFDRDFLETQFLPVLTRQVEQTAGTAPLEYVMREVVSNSSQSIVAFESAHWRWFEIDEASELQIAEEIFADLKKN